MRGDTRFSTVQTKTASLPSQMLEDWLRHLRASSCYRPESWTDLWLGSSRKPDSPMPFSARCAFTPFSEALPGAAAKVQDGAVHAALLAGLDPAFHVFLPSGDQRVDQASELARGCRARHRRILPGKAPTVPGADERRAFPGRLGGHARGLRDLVDRLGRASRQRLAAADAGSRRSPGSRSLGSRPALFACAACGSLLVSPRFTQAGEEPRQILSLLNEVTGKARAISDRRRTWFGPRYRRRDGTQKALQASHVNS